MTVQTIGNLTFLKGSKVSINLGQVIKVMPMTYEHRPTMVDENGEECYGEAEETVGYGFKTTAEAEELSWLMIGPKEGLFEWGHTRYQVIEDKLLFMEIKELFF